MTVTLTENELTILKRADANGSVEADKLVGIHYATLAKLERLGLLTITWKRQSALHGSSKAYRSGELTEAGLAALTPVTDEEMLALLDDMHTPMDININLDATRWIKHNWDFPQAWDRRTPAPSVVREFIRARLAPAAVESDAPTCTAPIAIAHNVACGEVLDADGTCPCPEGHAATWARGDRTRAIKEAQEALQRVMDAQIVLVDTEPGVRAHSAVQDLIRGALIQVDMLSSAIERIERM